MVKSPFTRDETNSLADRVQRSRKRRPRTHATWSQGHDDIRIDFLVFVDSAEAFDKAKGMQTAIQTMIPYCILNVQKHACGENP